MAVILRCSLTGQAVATCISALGCDRNTRALPLLGSRRVFSIGRLAHTGSGHSRGFAILALQPAWARSDHTPMRPGAGEYQVLGPGFAPDFHVTITFIWGSYV